MMRKSIPIQEYTYLLPEDRIALHPLSQRDQSKLLVYRNGEIENASFKNLIDFLPSNTTLFFNDTKVIPARLLFRKDTGAEIEIFLLSPLEPSTLMAEVMIAKHTCTWQCTIGNLKRWKEGNALTKEVQGILLTASLEDRNSGIVALSWNTDHTFAEVVTAMGITPLPPYIKRNASSEDVNRYQTVYSHYEGAVAAPTAGLHFTNQILEALQQKGIQEKFLTLHVSAGTFQPVKTENALEHTMHHEQIVATRKLIKNLLSSDRLIVAVGTTAMRTLESLYWFGVKLLNDPDAEFNITQNDPYLKEASTAKNEALEAIADYMDKRALTELTGTTSIFIYPGYTFRICKGLITNFHLPASTLMLLVAAFVGEDWKKIYNQALEKEYRFLSYGDSSLLIP